MSRRKKPPVTVYLIHFAQPLRHAQHYLGSAEDLAARLAEHSATNYEWFELPVEIEGRPHKGRKIGNGATLLGVVNSLGIDWEVVRTWNGTRDTEAKFKRARHNKQLCPKCRKGNIDAEK